MKTLILGVLAAASLAIALPAAAEPLNQREHRQDARIERGVQTGAISPKTAVRLHRREASIRHAERTMRMEHGGRLTRQDRKVLNHRLTRVSHVIHARAHRQAEKL
jgi:hypothetical protein